LGEIFPRDTGLEDENDPRESFAIIDGWPATFGTRWPLGNEGFNLLPEIIREEGLGHRNTLHEKSSAWGRSPTSIIRIGSPSG
jgi:hypothetical protein